MWTLKWCQKRELNNYFHWETLGQETDLAPQESWNQSLGLDVFLLVIIKGVQSEIKITFYF